MASARAARASRQLPGHDDPHAERLIRTAVFRRVPATTRGKLNKAVLVQGAGADALQKIAARLSLQEFGVSMAALRNYARTLEELVRPILASHLQAAILGCLPRSYRRAIADGSEVVLLSRLLGRLSGTEASSLSASDLGRLASAITASGKRNTGSRQAPGRPARSPRGTGGLAAAVRGIYGLTWPPPGDPASPADPQ